MRLSASLFMGCLVASTLMSPAYADPCGMLPQAFVNGPQVVRMGVQQTYVFYRNGVESIVIRPGYSGSVDEFGMLIPFPTPPSLRKVPDNVFAQIAAAIDPPEVVVQTGGFFGGGMGGGGFGGGGGGGLNFRPPRAEVRVIKEEAVGMYEVAVLEAGSAEALRIWMTDHSYRYPEGMDVPCEEYIRQGWCFVAVKTKVKQKAASEPRPGQTKVDNTLPEGSTFDGYVQAMGFRFRVSKPVVPMRLSVHNPGSLRNVVYMLTDEPCRIEQLPEAFVVRQVSGVKLLNNFRRPLPVRLIGAEQVPELLRNQVRRQRDPRPHNQGAAELFAADILASVTRRLTHSHEELEKQLLASNEQLGLRDDEIDQRVTDLLQQQRDQATQRGLGILREMTLTVLDADFPRNVLARQNLTFSSYRMPPQNSRRELYDALEMGRPLPKPGFRILGSLEASSQLLPSLVATTTPPRLNGHAMRWDGSPPVSGKASHNRHSPSQSGPSPLGVAGLLLLAAALGLRFGKHASAPFRFWSTAAAGLLVLAAAPSTAQFSDIYPEERIHSGMLQTLCNRLEDPQQVPKAAKQLIALGDQALPALVAQTQTRSIVRRGWAIACLGQCDHTVARARLADLLRDEQELDLVRVWAGAALLQHPPIPDDCRVVALMFPELRAIIEGREP